MKQILLAVIYYLIRNTRQIFIIFGVSVGLGQKGIGLHHVTLPEEMEAIKCSHFSGITAEYRTEMGSFCLKQKTLL